MTKKVKIIDSKDVPGTNSRKSPATLILESLEGEFLTMRQMAERIGVHTETMRRLCKAVDNDGNPKVKAPSKAVQTGDMTIYLFTPEDVEEIEEYFTKKGYVINTQ